MEHSSNISAIYENNKKNNKEKIQFFDFLMYSAKSEISVTELQSLFYWIGITECFIFLVSFALFISYPRQFGWLLFFITHVVRAVVGFLLLKYMPKTATVIDQLKNTENSSLSDINNQIIQSYKKLLEVNANRVRKLMFIYWIFTVIDIIEDMIIFFSLLATWGNITYNFKNIVTLVAISILFICNFSMVEWFFSIKVQFPPEIIKVINLSIFGELKRLKNIIGRKISNETNVEVQQNANNINNNGNNIPYQQP